MKAIFERTLASIAVVLTLTGCSTISQWNGLRVYLRQDRASSRVMAATVFLSDGKPLLSIRAREAVWWMHQKDELLSCAFKDAHGRVLETRTVRHRFEKPPRRTAMPYEDTFDVMLDPVPAGTVAIEIGFEESNSLGASEF